MEEVSGPSGVPRGPRAWAPGFTRVLRPCRVSDSDDLVMTESEVGRVALRIEKELFSLFHVTDNRYKSKYRSLMFNLKDPKNQVCAHAVPSAWRGAEGGSILKRRHPSSGSGKAPLSPLALAPAAGGGVFAHPPCLSCRPGGLMAP